MPTGNGRPIAFIDVEASGLGARSWPVEIGWATLDGAGEAHLVKPSEDWPMSAWDPSAEALHGISIDALRRDGLEPAVLCGRMNDALRGSAIFADSPDWDAFWLYRLFAAARMRPAFELHDFAAMILTLAPDNVVSVYAEADRTAPRCHRARADALHLLAVYRGAVQFQGGNANK